MIIGTTKEQNPQETRTALTPDVVKQLVSSGHHILVQKAAGEKSGFADESYHAAGAEIRENAEEILKESRILLQIMPPASNFIKKLTKSQILITDFSDMKPTELQSKATLLHLEKVPRTSVAQLIDIKSAQNTIRGYMAALHALYHSSRIVNQLTTAAASIKAAQALIIGAGVTGLQAASVFKRLGCRTTIADINEKSQELAQSVGADFQILSTEQEVFSAIQDKNLILTAALSPSGLSPQIIKREHLENLLPHTTLIDTTAGNIQIKENSLSTQNYTFFRNTCFERLAPYTASVLWANNMLNLLKLIITPNGAIDLSLEYIKPLQFTQYTTVSQTQNKGNK